MIRVIALAWLFLLPSCLAVNYVQFYQDEPIAEAEYSDLVAGESDLSACLSRLGAPNIVWHSSSTDKVRMAYAWVDMTDWGFSLSWDFGVLPTSVDLVEYDSTNTGAFGIVLMFDEKLQLELIKRGYLSELVPSGADAGRGSDRLGNVAY